MPKFADRNSATRKLPQGLRVEQMMPEHLDAVLSIEQTFAAPWTRRMFVQELEKQWENADSLVVLDDEDRLLGYVLFWFVAEEVHVVNVAVHPRARRRGIGRCLMHEVFERAIARGMAIATLEVRVHNQPAIKLYEDLHFKAVAVRKKYYADNGEDALVMVKYFSPTG